MDLTREQALELHREMWTNMQKELGDCPTMVERLLFKARWVRKRFPKEEVCGNCFLCEYVDSVQDCRCSRCPINWGRDGESTNYCEKTISGIGVDWRYSPISEILALPERC
jgi:hypothetical protein